MFVEIKNNIDGMNFGDFSGGDLIYCENETYVVLPAEIHDTQFDETYNAVNLETGEPTFFPSDYKVVCPKDYTLTIEL